jgi:hypothetical protein
VDPVIARAHHGGVSEDLHPDDDAADAWLPMVALRHVRRDHPDHVDWLLARDAAGAGPLWSFRAAAPPTTPPTAPLGLRLIADHRPRYLTYEGPVSDDRGTVRRLASGQYRLSPDANGRDGAIRLQLAWSGTAPYFVTIGTKVPGRADAGRIEPPPAERGEEPVRWLVADPD